MLLALKHSYQVRVSNETPAADTQKLMIKDSKYRPQKVFKPQRKIARD